MGPFITIGGHSNSYCLQAYNESIINMRPPEKQSISNTKPVDEQEPEVTVICVDNSFLLPEEMGGLDKPQAKAINLYAKQIIKAHEKNEVGLLAMGLVRSRGFVQPTRNIHEIRLALKRLTYFGQSSIPIEQALTFFINSNLPKRRLLVFSGGRLVMDSADLEFYATRLKEFEVAVDVVNFGLQYLPTTKAKLLEAFVKAADNGGNSRYLYAPSESATSLGRQILCSRLAPGGLKMQKEKEKEQEVKKKEKIDKHLLAAQAEEEEKKKEEEERRKKKNRDNKLKKKMKKLRAKQEEKKKEEEEVKKREEEEKKKEEEEVKEKMEHKLMWQLPVEQLVRWIDYLPLQEEKKKKQEVKKKKQLPMREEKKKDKLDMAKKRMEHRLQTAAPGGLPMQEEKKKEEVDEKGKDGADEEEVKEKERLSMLKKMIEMANKRMEQRLLTPAPRGLPMQEEKKKEEVNEKGKDGAEEKEKGKKELLG